MPTVDGVIPKKKLPVFFVVQQFGDERDAVYRDVLDSLLQGIESRFEESANAEAEVYLITFAPNGVFSTKALLGLMSSVDMLPVVQVEELEGSFENALCVLSEDMSRRGCLTSEIGYFCPLIYFCVEDLGREAEAPLKLTMKTNKWIEVAKKTAFHFASGEDMRRMMFEIDGHAYTVPEKQNETEWGRFLQFAANPEVSFRMHALQQTGNICARLFHENWKENADCTISLGSEEKKILVAVDPIEENDRDDTLFFESL